PCGASGQFAATARQRGIDVVDGCEISVRWRGEEWHLLAYHVDPDDEVFAERVGVVSARGRARFGRWLERFEAFGVPVDPAPVADLLATTHAPYFGRFLDVVVPSLAGYPAFAGYATRPYPELVRDWFAVGRPFHVPEPPYPDVAEALDWIDAAGGVAVLAHPARALAPAELADALPPLVGRGLGGIEVWTTWHPAAVSARLADLARRLGLVPTQGSDFHGPVKPWAPVPGALPAAARDPYEIVGRLRERVRPRSGKDGGRRDHRGD
ncbi:MAG TPA: hypothetical protein VKP11_04285, partial [Frankiaceae bacterium]|nr:hypothetical protein [Frankiaceae bacterium]